MRKPARDPWLRDAMTNKPPHDRDPSDILEGGGYAGPVRGGAGAGRGALNQTSVDKRAHEQAAVFLKKPPKEKLTDHGGVRTSERLPSVQEIDDAVKSAVSRGQYTVKKGKYGSDQIVYKGDNGLTVIIETEGRNAGKVITVFGESHGGKL